MKKSTPIKGFLIDLDGVLYIEKQIIPGAIQAIEYLQRKRYPFLLVTNTTRRSRLTLLTNLQRFGFRIHLEQIFSAPYAASLWLKEHNAKAISLFVRGDVYREFSEFRVTTNKPEYIVLGDIGEDLTYAAINQAFRLVLNGAEMVALQKNRFWLRGDGLAVDAGAIVTALEYATRQRATLVGKPSEGFFNNALNRLNIAAGSVAIIGDDIETDIKGGIKAGLQGILVRSGKYRESSISRKQNPGYVTLESIADLPEWLESNQ